MAENKRAIAAISRELAEIGAGGAALEATEQDLATAVREGGREGGRAMRVLLYRSSTRTKIGTCTYLICVQSICRCKGY